MALVFTLNDGAASKTHTINKKKYRITRPIATLFRTTPSRVHNSRMCACSLLDIRNERNEWALCSSCSVKSNFVCAVYYENAWFIFKLVFLPAYIKHVAANKTKHKLALYISECNILVWPHIPLKPASFGYTEFRFVAM